MLSSGFHPRQLEPLRNSTHVSVCMVLIAAQRFGYQIAEIENQYLSGERNISCDDMSRR